MRSNINALLDKAQRIIASRRHDEITLEYEDGTRATVTAWEAVDQAKSRTDIVRASGGPGQGLLPQLISALYEGEAGQ